mmetsp:Transcript_23207/g.32452  ORF Transcript_23207/g.32452 Transcript_23207/m.32452 type:complete len:243 (+) Transcript_23207:81-809(+)|eukprot:CAMPEP_0185276742 /NCGR_PEP_ID=MMETSP1359-20130426/56884_1 /TAXON_ID=552665 /ORGANISM="Bigelowiella longifila, Strain CCMP242" /LENGTH=242 /DNA_ID=CAMNT_0027870537 /DNA_START=166 /DNA_END=894 /DNA_ORIENTATION=+
MKSTRDEPPKVSSGDRKVTYSKATTATKRIGRKKNTDKDFDEEGTRILSGLAAKGKGSRYANLTVIWTHPKTEAHIYVGNITAASTRKILDRHEIRNIVNCQGRESTNYFEENKEFNYFRFPVSYWWKAKGMDTHKGVEKYFNPVFNFISSALEKGENCLVHCLAGAHRAGTTGVACLMYFGNMSFKEALADAKLSRPIINPIGQFPELLQKLDSARQKKEGNQSDASSKKCEKLQKTTEQP